MHVGKKRGPQLGHLLVFNACALDGKVQSAVATATIFRRTYGLCARIVYGRGNAEYMHAPAMPATRAHCLRGMHTLLREVNTAHAQSAFMQYFRFI